MKNSSKTQFQNMKSEKRSGSKVEPLGTLDSGIKCTELIDVLKCM